MVRKIKLTTPFGQIDAIIISNPRLNTSQKLIYCIIASSQGKQEYSKITNEDLRKSLGMTSATISHGLKILKDEGILEGHNGHFAIIMRDKSEGSKFVENDVLIDPTLCIGARVYFAFLMSKSDLYYKVKIDVESITKAIKVSKNTLKSIRIELVNCKLLEGVNCGKWNKECNVYHLNTLYKLKEEDPVTKSIHVVFERLKELFYNKHKKGKNNRLPPHIKEEISGLLLEFDDWLINDMLTDAFEKRNPKNPSLIYYLRVIKNGDVFLNEFR